MGNSIMGCSGNGERLMTAAMDGDVAEASKLLEMNPNLARYSTFGLLNSPLHLAASRGHNEVVALLLESGADVNSRNIYGQTPLMQACRYGHWEVVQTLLVFKSDVWKTECLGNKTALHFAAAGGHVRCIRLLAADFEETFSCNKYGVTDHSNERSVLASYINKSASGAVTALHMAALKGDFESVNLLLDLHASVTAQALPYASSSNASIGAGSTPLHYAASGGNLQCCQVLISRGASRSAMNCNGWLPIDVARIWGCYWLEQWLSPKSNLIIPNFAPSCYLSLPLPSVLHIAREYGLQSAIISDDEIDENDMCAVCLERACNVQAEGCGHELCIRCAFNLCSTIKANEISNSNSTKIGIIPCPLCRGGIESFKKSPIYQTIEQDLNSSPSPQNKSIISCKPEYCKNSVAIVPSEVIDPLHY